MKSAFVFFAGILLLTGQAVGAEDTSLQSQKDKVSYAIGLQSGKNLRRQFIDIDAEMMGKGLRDSLSGGKMLLTDQEMQEVMTAFKKEMEARQPEIRKAMAERNKKEGEAFLAENRTREGVKTLASGLQYEVIREGKGNHPKTDDAVAVHYRASRLDGSEFDSSYRRNAPATFSVSQGYRGWEQVLPLMKEGAKFRVFVPSNLGYGEEGSGPVEPNATLIYDVEMMDIYTAMANPPPPARLETKSPKPAEKSSKPASKPSKPAGGR